MGRLVVLPSEVKSLYLMLHQAFQMGLPTGPALLIPSNSQDSIPESVFFCSLSFFSKSQDLQVLQDLAYHVLQLKRTVELEPLPHPQLSISGFLITGRQFATLTFFLQREKISSAPSKKIPTYRLISAFSFSSHSQGLYRQMEVKETAYASVFWGLG